MFLEFVLLPNNASIISKFIKLFFIVSKISQKTNTSVSTIITSLKLIFSSNYRCKNMTIYKIFQNYIDYEINEHNFHLLFLFFHLQINK